MEPPTVERTRRARSAQALFILPFAVAWAILASTAAFGAPAAAKHWAFTPPQRPEIAAPPAAARAGWARNPIDRFVLARLAQERLEPSPEADRAALLRRLSLDLLGLPPEPAEVDAFVDDSSLDAYERAVERLLASPHYGEKWGRHWLDAARYADSNGYEKDRAREMWHYRDWVVAAFNRDLPYDRFIIEQIAGDLLPGASQDELIATGFLRNSMFNEEGAIDPEEFRMEAMFDRMECIGKSILGITIQCAQCHSHKYDPLSQEEYYRMFAFINNADELTAPFYTPAQLAERDAVLRGIREAEDEIKRRHPDWPDRLSRWEAEARGGQPEWTVLEPYEHGDPGGLSKLQLQRDLSVLAGGHRFQGGTWRVKARTRLTGIRALRMEALTNGNLPMRGPGRSERGLFALRELTVEAAPADGSAKPAKVSFRTASADFEEPQKPPGASLKDPKQHLYGPVRFAIDGEPRTSWTIDAGPGLRNSDRKAVFAAADPVGFPGGTELTFQLSMEDEVACFRLSVATEENAAADPLPRLVREALAARPERRSPAQAAAVFGYWRTTVEEFAETNRRIDDIWKRYPESAGTTLVLAARPEDRATHVLKRGSWLSPLDSVAPGVPAFLHALPSSEPAAAAPAADAPRSRLAFAQWLADRGSPTTARAFANRVWEVCFGAGLVATLEDFGTQGARPSHPELLDWLACEFMDPKVRLTCEEPPRPWSVKHLLRLILGSGTYRQSSRVLPEDLERDPQNRLLARGPRLRVEGEVVRDIALAASGLLNRELGGPPIFSPAPEFLFRPPTSYDTFPWKEEVGANRYRRAFYTFRRRSTPYPALQTFDAPSGEFSCVRRQRSNTPLQALTTLNETLFVEAARALALKTLAEGGRSDGERIGFAFRRSLGRLPSEREMELLRGLMEKQRRRIAEGWLDAAELGTGRDETPKGLPEGTTPADLAAITVLSRVLLNLDETITKE